jgi:hypothetical protein
MLNAPHTVDSGARQPRRRFEFPLSQAHSTQRQDDRRLVLGTWRDALAALDARIREFQQWSANTPASSRVELDWCIACLADVRSALYQLQACIVDWHLPLSSRRSAVVSYLSEAYVWCGDVHEDVQALVDRLRGGSRGRDATIARDSSAYIDDFLEPLFHQICEGAHRAARPQPPFSALLLLAERLHVAIVSLDWTLRAE